MAGSVAGDVWTMRPVSLFAATSSTVLVVRTPSAQCPLSYPCGACLLDVYREPARRSPLPRLSRIVPSFRTVASLSPLQKTPPPTPPPLPLPWLHLLSCAQLPLLRTLLSSAGTGGHALACRMNGCCRRGSGPPEGRQTGTYRWADALGTADRRTRDGGQADTRRRTDRTRRRTDAHGTADRPYEMADRRARDGGQTRSRRQTDSRRIRLTVSSVGGLTRHEVALSARESADLGYRWSELPVGWM